MKVLAPNRTRIETKTVVARSGLIANPKSTADDDDGTDDNGNCFRWGLEPIGSWGDTFPLCVVEKSLVVVRFGEIN